MIHGLVSFPIRGVIWYQGETDTWNAEEYVRMFPDLIKDWRSRWGQGDFHPADARLDGSSVVVWRESVPTPVYLRYGFRGFPDCNLFNSVGLPVAPDR